MASTAFLVRFSITHSNSDSEIFTGKSSAGKCRFTDTLPLMRDRIYSSERVMAALRYSSFSSGTEPILEKRSAMVERRFTSLSISAAASAVASASPSERRSKSVHAISDEMGVPN